MVPMTTSGPRTIYHKSILNGFQVHTKCKSQAIAFSSLNHKSMVETAGSSPSRPMVTLNMNKICVEVIIHYVCHKLIAFFENSVELYHKSNWLSRYIRISSHMLQKPRPETLQNTIKLLSINHGRFLRERMNFTSRTAHLKRSSRVPQPINDARVVCHGL